MQDACRYLPLFDPTQRGTLAFQDSFDMGARPGKP
jgi:hypothetical protein